MPKRITIDTLAEMVKEGFEKTASKADLVEIKTELSQVKTELSEFKVEVKHDLEDIKLRLDNTAYKFEIQDHERRITALEQK